MGGADVGGAIGISLLFVLLSIAAVSYCWVFLRRFNISNTTIITSNPPTVCDIQS